MPNLKKYIAVVGVIFFGVFSMSGPAVGHEYVGAKKCSICHKTPAQGEQYSKWQSSKHAKAFETLGTAAAKETGARLGVADPQSDGKCLRCHATAYAGTTERVSQTIAVEEGVSCESCHGPGKDYLKMDVMKNRSAAVAAGLVVAGENTCLLCHNNESPNYRPFDYAVSWAGIEHPVPEKKDR